MVFHWSLSDNKSHQVSMTFLSILADLNNAVLRMVSIRPAISNSSRSFSKPWKSVQSAPVKIGITVTLMFHRFLTSLAGSRYFSFFSFFVFLSVGPREGKVHYTTSPLFFANH